jgi:hypothetical protein
MAQDVFKPKGPTKASQPDAGGANARTVPVFGVVKDNIDPTRSGRLQVYISDFGGDDPDNRDNWISVSYMTPFYGYTQPDANESGYGTYKDNPSSYGMWFAQPDIGTQVICIFINGDVNYGFWIGCVPKPDALTMVPAIGATDNIVPNEGEAQSYGGAVRLPVTNINTNNEEMADSNDYINAAKPVHSYVAGIMSQQGIIRDPVRGPISSSAQRETPSRVGWGVSTPGRPIYEGGFDDESLAQNLEGGTPQSLRVVARRGGHSIVMDDGDIIGRDQLIRIRTALGHQILMSDDGQTLMVLHSNGQSYIELGKEGTVDIYSTNSINLRTQGDLNLHADNNVNIHATKDLNIQGENININTEKDMNVRNGVNYKHYTLSDYTVKVDAAMSMESGGDSSFVSKNITYINGEKINLNTGATSTIPKEVDPIPIIAHTDTLFDDVKGFAACPGKLLSIVTRAPAHTPWANAGQGVDVKTDVSAKGNLPASPTPAQAAVNTASAAVAGTPVSVATTVSMPATTAVSGALDKNTTSAVLGTMAKNAATGPLQAAAAQGAAIVQQGTQKVAAIGAFAQSPTQMMTAGVLKPGSDKLVQSLVSSGANITQSMPASLFTGQKGAETLSNYINNTTAQATAQVVNLQKAQSALTAAGAISGKESAGQLAGIVMAGATSGVSSTLNALTSAASNPGAALASSTEALKSIGAGNLAASVAQNVTGGLGGISKALGAMSASPGLSGLLDSAKGVAGSAFSAITGSFKPMTAGIPQNLTALAKTAAQATASASGQTGVLSASSLVSSATGAVTGAVSSLTGAASALTSVGGAGALASAASAVASGGVASAASSLASGLSNLPGGQKTVQAVVNNAQGAINSLPGTAAITGLVQQASTAALNKLPLPSLPSGLNSLTNLATSGLAAGAAAQLTSAISALSSGGSVSIKLPTIGLNTVDRSGITAQIASVFGDPKIPKPNLVGEVSEGAKSAAEQQAEKIREEVKYAQELQVFNEKIRDARLAYYTAKRDLPQGDPGIIAARDKWFALTEDAEYIDLRKKLGIA